MTIEETQYYSPQTIAKMLDVNRMTVWRYLETGQLPEPVRVSPKCPRWKRADVEKLLQSIEEQSTD